MTRIQARQTMIEALKVQLSKSHIGSLHATIDAGATAILAAYKQGQLDAAQRITERLLATIDPPPVAEVPQPTGGVDLSQPLVRQHVYFTAADFANEDPDNLSPIANAVIEGGLKVCKVCGQYEGGLLPECPGPKEST